MQESKRAQRTSPRDEESPQLHLFPSLPPFSPLPLSLAQLLLPFLLWLRFQLLCGLFTFLACAGGEKERDGEGGWGEWQHFACRSTWRHVASRRHRAGVERRWNPLLVLLQVTCSFNASAPWAEANKLWEQASVQRLPEQEQGAVVGGSGAESPEMPR